MRVYDAVASVVKSGGKTRRAPRCRRSRSGTPTSSSSSSPSRRKSGRPRRLISSGYEANFNGEAYSSVMFQNANLTVRVTDAFLRAVEAGGEWTTRAVTTGRPMDYLSRGAPDGQDRRGDLALRRPRPPV
jgi:ribonucleoside-diphosphate reductase alpha chain